MRSQIINPLRDFINNFNLNLFLILRMKFPVMLKSLEFFYLLVMLYSPFSLIVVTLKALLPSAILPNMLEVFLMEVIRHLKWGLAKRLSSLLFSSFLLGAENRPRSFYEGWRVFSIRIPFSR